MQLYTLTTPLTVISNSVSSPAAKITALEITGISMNKRPALAPIGSGDLTVTLTDPTSGFQESIKTAFNPDAFWASVTVADGQTIEDAVQVALFGVLTANKLLPDGTLSAA
jgi:hypothetical protein